jgi:hypothetical protein
LQKKLQKKELEMGEGERSVAPDIAAAHKIILDCGKRTDFWHLVLLGKKVLSKESSPSIMVTRNPNW